MEKFTKGQWWVNHVGPHENNPAIQSYEVCYSEDAECVVDHVYELSDAHLIAAAPEMYEMLKGVRSEIYTLINMVNEQMKSEVTSHTENEPDYWDMETLHLIDCLLSKARGEA